MKRFILTGAPGAGKTVILRQLEQEGFGVVEEAATDLIALWQARGVAEPWKESSFLDAIAELQKRRQMRAAAQADAIQFHDRSVVCTAALAAYLRMPRTAALERELERILAQRVFERQVFFVRNLGFVVKTEARRISFQDALRFERVHEETYRSFGFEIVWIDAGAPEERAAAIQAGLRTADIAGVTTGLKQP
jgi:predicted ATPase